MEKEQIFMVYWKETGGNLAFGKKMGQLELADFLKEKNIELLAVALEHSGFAAALSGDIDTDELKPPMLN